MVSQFTLRSARPSELRSAEVIEPLELEPELFRVSIQHLPCRSGVVRVRRGDIAWSHSARPQ